MFWRTCVCDQRDVGCPTKEDDPGPESDHSTGKTVPLTTVAVPQQGPWALRQWLCGCRSRIRLVRAFKGCWYTQGPNGRFV